MPGQDMIDAAKTAVATAKDVKDDVDNMKDNVATAKDVKKAAKGKGSTREKIKKMMIRKRRRPPPLTAPRSLRFPPRPPLRLSVSIPSVLPSPSPPPYRPCTSALPPLQPSTRSSSRVDPSGR